MLYSSLYLEQIISLPINYYNHRHLLYAYLLFKHNTHTHIYIYCTLHILLYRRGVSSSIKYACRKKDRQVLIVRVQ